MEHLKNEELTLSNSRFSAARSRVLREDEKGEGIGRLSEKSQHKILKYYIEPNEEYHEVKILGSVADIKNSDGIYEIQTRSTERLIPKLRRFLTESSVTVVLPFASEKMLSWVDTESGDISAPKKSPKREGIFDAVLELSKIKEFIRHPNLKIKLLFLSVSEYRYRGGESNFGKHRSTRLERIPNFITEEIDIKSIDELEKALPKELFQEFTRSDFKKLNKRTERRNYFILRFLCDMGIVEKVGTRGRAFVYRGKRKQPID